MTLSRKLRNKTLVLVAMIAGTIFLSSSNKVEATQAFDCAVDHWVCLIDCMYNHGNSQDCVNACEGTYHVCTTLPENPTGSEPMRIEE